MPRLAVNFASVPFANKVVPLTAMGILGGLAVLLTVLNLTLFGVFGGEYRKLRSTTAQQQERLKSLNEEIQGNRKQMSSPEVATFLGEAKFLDGVLRAKSFSWSELLARLEEAKAYGVMVQSVNPSVDREGKITITLRGVANPRDELLKFENGLFASAYFRNATLRGEQKDPANPWTQFDITVDYGPEGFAPEPLPPPYPPPPEGPGEDAGEPADGGAREAAAAAPPPASPQVKPGSGQVREATTGAARPTPATPQAAPVPPAQQPAPPKAAPAPKPTTGPPVPAVRRGGPTRQRQGGPGAPTVAPPSTPKPSDSPGEPKRGVAP